MRELGTADNMVWRQDDVATTGWLLYLIVGQLPSLRESVSTQKMCLAIIANIARERLHKCDLDDPATAQDNLRESQ